MIFRRTDWKTLRHDGIHVSYRKTKGVCDCEGEPWLNLSQCGAAHINDDSGVIEFVSCRSLWCALEWVALLDGRIVPHMNLRGGTCAWSGLCVVDDRDSLPEGWMQPLEQDLNTPPQD
ncbi:hypothetical protein ACIBCN_19835 [Nocardia sp. NPDC051052]|uniref:hypothetical protein n=1 Tax=Nocardia sp. NPDC051052 TaxID=3364322 RepID=UPI0037AFF94A